MRTATLLSLILIVPSGCDQTERQSNPPLASGDYIFAVRFAEHPDIKDGELHAEVRGRHIRVISRQGSSVFPAGLVEEGDLLWHPASRSWIIAQNQADEVAEHVGGCSDGPSIVDLERKIYWTC